LDKRLEHDRAAALEGRKARPRPGQARRPRASTAKEYNPRAQHPVPLCATGGGTIAGRELHETFLPLHRFAERWSKLRAN